MGVKGGEIEVDRGWSHIKRIGKGANMGGTGQNTNAPAKGTGQPAKPVPAPAPIEDDDIEDGDIASPKRDRSGSDDEPL